MFFIRTKEFIRSTFIHLVLLILVFFCLFFFLLLFINATKNKTDLLKDFSPLPGTHGLENMESVLNDGNIPILYGILNSLIVAGGSTLAAVYSSLLAAYGLYMYRFRFRNLYLTIIVIMMVMPLQVCALGFLRNLTRLGLDDHLLALILPALVSPAAAFFLYTYLKSVLPKSYIDSARIDGAGEYRIFTRIVVPIMRPAMAVQAIFSFVASWNNYFIPALVMSTKNKLTLPVMIAMIRNADFVKKDMGKAYMMICFSVFPIIIIYLLLSREILDGVMQGAEWNKE